MLRCDSAASSYRASAMKNWRTLHVAPSPMRRHRSVGGSSRRRCAERMGSQAAKRNLQLCSTDRTLHFEIGRASCRERGQIAGVDASLDKNTDDSGEEVATYQ